MGSFSTATRKLRDGTLNTLHNTTRKLRDGTANVANTLRKGVVSTTKAVSTVHNAIGKLSSTTKSIQNKLNPSTSSNPQENKQVIKSEDVTQTFEKMLEKGLKIQLPLPTLPIPAGLILKASMTATRLFELVNNTINEHKEDVVDFLKARLALFKNKAIEANLVTQNQIMQTVDSIKTFKKSLTNDSLTKGDIEVPIEVPTVKVSQSGGSTFSQEECSFF